MLGTVIMIFAALLGGVLPLLALALLVRWRLVHSAARRYSPALVAEGPSEREQPGQSESPHEGESVGTLGLGWLQGSIGAPEVRPGATRDEPVRCHHCGHLQEAPSFFCRRCRSSLGPLRRER
jgi:hypothetical protein